MYICLYVCMYVCMRAHVCIYIYLFVGRGGALVETMTFNRRVVGSTPALAATQGPWASPLLAVAFALRRETPIQYSCCGRDASE